MKSAFEVQKTSRNIILKILENHSLEQLNKIPEGYNNNIIWNIGHIIASQQALVYKLSGLSTMVSDEFMNKYKKGTKPEDIVSQTEIDEIKTLLEVTFLQTAEDFIHNIFTNYTKYTTSMGITLRNVEEAINFNNYHEGIHTGIIMSIRKFV
ncbi:DinB family protein [Flavobacterium piscis]|uniref:DinB-like domain-containing protein n=1 Tax=Flavobacterium piscis TaxID=1114874 RepID=A0ABU1Y626_9FLAO|nr:DinB family protein [Flavobacterium piscis]MDR7209593.1 hypothetical protein [Flavobacterium piscis]